MKNRCDWPQTDLMIKYHDEEWGTPLHDDLKIFEFLCLESFQAGLSWSTILNRRKNFSLAFDGFDPEKIVGYNNSKIDELMINTGIIRNRKKIEAVINNAAHFLRLQSEYGSFDNYIWQFTNYKTIVNKWETTSQIPAVSGAAEAMSKALRKQGFKFTGPVICYAHMQATGMINDHLVSCYRYRELLDNE